MKTKDLLQLIGGLFISLMFGFAVSRAIPVNAMIPSLLLFASMFFAKPMGLAYASSLDLSALPGKLKDYALENKDVLLTKLLVDTMPEYMTPLTGVRDEVPLSELVVDSIIQPGNKDTYDPLNNKIKFKARIGKVRPVKVDLQLKPTQITNLQKSYYGLVDAGRIDPYTLPFEAFIMGRIVKQVKNDIRLKALFKGVYNASGTAPVDTMKGLLSIITDDAVAGNKTTGAAIIGSNAYDEVMKLVDLVEADANYGNAEMGLLISRANFRKYCNDYAATRGSVPYNTEFGKMDVEGTNIKFVVEPGLTGSDRLIVTPLENLYWLTNDEAAMGAIKVEYALRNINIMIDFHCAPDFGIMETVWVNDYSGIA